MNSILREISQNSGKKSSQELMETYNYFIDEELNKLFSKTDCVDNYSQHFHRFKEDHRSYYRCLHNSCPFQTNKSSLIVRHIRRHLKERPYMCPMDGCADSFYQRCDLKCHLIRHFEDKPFKCHLQDCSKNYTTRKALSLHIKTHSPFAFNCKECHKMFATNWKLNKHFRQRHSPSASDQSMTETTIEDISQPIEPKVESKTSSEDKTSNDLRQQLIYSMNSIDSMSDQIRDQLLSKDSIKSISAGFGFEEVIKYVINNCGLPSNRQIIENKTLTPDSGEASDRITPNNSDAEPNNNDSYLRANQLLIKCVESVGSLIETYTFISIDSNKKVLFKCINCFFTSDTIQTIVEHVFDHISGGVTQQLRNQLI